MMECVSQDGKVKTRTLFKQLQTDHINLRLVIDILCDTFYSWRSENDPEHSPGTISLMCQAVDYIQAYPEHYHHPLEEAAFNFCEANNLGPHHIIQQLRQQHKLLEQETPRIRTILDWITRQIPLTESDETLFNRYIAMQKHHIDIENRYIFPTLARLEAGDWWNIASCMALQQDPLFSAGPESQRQFDLLLNSIRQRSPIAKANKRRSLIENITV